MGGDVDAADARDTGQDPGGPDGVWETIDAPDVADVADDGLAAADDGGADGCGDAPCTDPAPACWRRVRDESTCECELEQEPDDTPCDDGNACTVEDRCHLSVCGGRLVDIVEHCDDGNPCTLDNCDPMSGCVHAAAPASCDDGDLCTEGEVCEDGVCQPPDQYVCGLCTEGAGDTCEADYGDGNPCNGVHVCVDGLCEVDPSTVVQCAIEDSDPCTKWVCNPASGKCEAVAAEDGKACTDMSPCTIDDACEGGLCVGTPSTLAACGCGGDGDCDAVDDGDKCNGVFICDDGRCVFDFDSVVDCGGVASGCFQKACDPETGVCVPQFATAGTPCDDEDVCTSEDQCDGEGECVGTTVDCSDLTGSCTSGECVEGVGCVATPVHEGGDCASGALCAAGGLCDSGECVAYGVADCDDDDACTLDSCDPAQGCTHEGPAPPDCLTAGVCAGGVPVVCTGTGGQYVCDYEAVADYSALDVVDGLDNDCDGEMDEDEIAASACAAGELVAAFGDGMQACEGQTSGEQATSACAQGWHVCTYSQMRGWLDGEPPPPGYWLAAAVAYEAGVAGVVDNPGGACVSDEGKCSGDRELQAKTASGAVIADAPYVQAAWGCSGGQPSGSCDALELAGVMCCMHRCDDDAECDDGDACTVDSCTIDADWRCVNEPVAAPTCLKEGVCAAGVPVVCLDEGVLSCDYDAVDGYEATETSCDGLDNDCDGLVDAADPDLAAVEWPDCEDQDGVCAGAKKTAAECVGGVLVECPEERYGAHSGAYQPEESACDGYDNDCDGQTDEATKYQGIAVGQACTGVGTCGAGTVECGADGSSAVCSTNPDGSDPRDTAEVCDGADNDCDGNVDDGVDPLEAGCASTGVCGVGVPATCEGVEGWSCDYGAIEGWEAEEASCDDLDNDCDGQTDEGFTYGDPPVGKGQGCGSGACTGVTVCDTESNVLACSTELGGGVELCDGEDNDCDGETDEGLVYTDPVTGTPLGKGETCNGRGECGTGTVECGGGGAITCSTNPDGSASEATGETCNEADDDCDGKTDEGFLYQGAAVGQPCEGTGECGAGLVECTAAGGVACSTNPGGSAPEDVPETCNDMDDDCNGFTDDGMDVTDSDCKLTGVCTSKNVVATCTGAAWVCDYSGVDRYREDDEVGACDNFDNDCDGQTDEDFPTKGQACDGADADLCENGQLKCSGDGSSVTCQGDAAVIESCNGEDDDCDGVTDEPGASGCSNYYLDADGDGLGTGEAQCLCGPDVAGNVDAKLAGDCDDARADIYPNAPELCDGADNDCDGKTDAADSADLLADDPRMCENQEGVCDGVRKPASLCSGGVWDACTPSTYALLAGPDYESPAETRCDMKDNDCDGQVDSADPDLALVVPYCEQQSGVCYGSRKTPDLCTYGQWYPCTAATYSAHSAEYEESELTCESKDNDCDGLTDEPFRYEGRQIGQSCGGIGECGPGHVECAPGGTSATCSTNPDGSYPEDEPEVCNNKDDDCDGLYDEGLGVEDSTCKLTGVCTVENVDATCSSGTWVCNYSGVPGYDGTFEAHCDAKDNDCDGQVDEDFTYDDGSGGALAKGDACGTGACAGGVVVCTAAGDGLICSTESGAGGEICDELDNDCNGETDEGLFFIDGDTGDPIALGEPCDGYGECGVGVVECNQEGGVTCSTHHDGTASQVSDEICDGLDNDCDLASDEDFIWQGRNVGDSCDDVFGECVVTCVGDYQASCYPASGSPQEEVCDGHDQDCDGQTDDGLGVLDSDCALAGVCNAANVSASCLGEAGWACDYSGVDGYDAEEDGTSVCDELDNDCDGETDESFPELGAPCDGDDADLCEYGAWVCAADGVGVSCLDEQPQQEYCNGQDDDCDSEVDEEGAADCTIYHLDDDGDGWGVEADWRCLCAPDGASGYTATEPGDCDDADKDINPDATEVCDGVDNDCDGHVDDEALYPNVGKGLPGCLTYYEDLDHDHYGSSQNALCLCGPRGDHTAEIGGDCDDQAWNVNPGAKETCNGYDNNCDGMKDQVALAECPQHPALVAYYQDSDYDGFGKDSTGVCICPLPITPWVTTPGDCNDANSNVNPDATEVCDGVDNDCDGHVDDYDYFIEDPSWGDKCSGRVQPIGGGNCLEGCVNRFADADDDGWGEIGSAKCLCDAMGAYQVTVSGDCCDADSRVNAGASEFFATAAPESCLSSMEGLLYDFDCDGTEKHEHNRVGSCACSPSCTGCDWVEGWTSFLGQLPDCGTVTKYITDCKFGGFECTATTVLRGVACR